MVASKIMVLTKVAVPMARFSQSEESLAKHEKQFEPTDHETNCSYTSHSRCHSTELRLKQKYVNTYKIKVKV